MVFSKFCIAHRYSNMLDRYYRRVNKPQGKESHQLPCKAYKLTQQILVEVGSLPILLHGPALRLLVHQLRIKQRFKFK